MVVQFPVYLSLCWAYPCTVAPIAAVSCQTLGSRRILAVWLMTSQLFYVFYCFVYGQSRYPSCKIHAIKDQICHLNLLTPVVEIRGWFTLHASFSGDVVVPRSCRCIGDRAFSIVAPWTWNSWLPTDLKLLRTALTSTSSTENVLVSVSIWTLGNELRWSALWCTLGLLVGLQDKCLHYCYFKQTYGTNWLVDAVIVCYRPSICLSQSVLYWNG